MFEFMIFIMVASILLAFTTSILYVNDRRYYVDTRPFIFTICLFCSISLTTFLIFTTYKRVGEKIVQTVSIEHQNGVKHTYFMYNNKLYNIDKLGQLSERTKIGLPLYRHPIFGEYLNIEPQVVNEL